MLTHWSYRNLALSHRFLKTAIAKVTFRKIHDSKLVFGQGSRVALHWRHNDHDGVSNHQPHGCLLSCLFRRRSKKTSKLRVTGLCVGNSPGPVNSPHKGPVTRKMFPFDDVNTDKAINLRIVVRSDEISSINFINTLWARQDGRHFADDIFKCIFLNENVWIPIEISLNFVPKGPIDNIPALV